MIKELKPIYQLLDNYRDEIPCDAPEACRNCTDPDCGHEWRYTDALIKLMGMYVMLHRENERRKMTIRCYDEALNAMLDRKEASLSKMRYSDLWIGDLIFYEIAEVTIVDMILKIEVLDHRWRQAFYWRMKQDSSALHAFQFTDTTPLPSIGRVMRRGRWITQVKSE